DQISPDTEPYTRAPEWAIALGKKNAGLRKKLGLVPDYGPADATGGVWGWPRKIDYAFRQGQPGAIGGLVDLFGKGVKGKNAREMSEAQRWLARGAVRAITYDANQGELNRLYDESEVVQGEMSKLRRRIAPGTDLRISADNSTPEYDRLRERASEIETRMNELQIETRPGGLVNGERVVPDKKKKKKPSGRLPTTGGRLPTDGGRLPTSGARLPTSAGALPTG
ncbi:MAG TPA: hypothetical protein VK631_20240, partial [Solirubrobacteraceae bacterium]|nr:hypothetical protein [Solirubrobacteraceae bacterium]